MPEISEAVVDPERQVLGEGELAEPDRQLRASQ